MGLWIVESGPALLPQACHVPTDKAHSGAGAGAALRCLNSRNVGSQHMEPGPAPCGPRPQLHQPIHSLRSWEVRTAPHSGRLQPRHSVPEKTVGSLKQTGPAACWGPES